MEHAPDPEPNDEPEPTYELETTYKSETTYEPETTYKSEPTYEPELTGLIIVDPYNDFLSEGGKLYEASRSTLESYDVVEHMRQVLAAARAARVQVFIAPHHRWRDTDPYSRWKTAPPIQAAAAEARVFADGTWGGSFHPDFQPRPGEVVAQEHWLSSGFANTDLDLQLKKHGVRKLVVIGLRANTCIESTVRFAAELGYEVTLVKDAVGSFGAAEMTASLQFNVPAYARAVVSAEEIVAKLPVRQSELPVRRTALSARQPGGTHHG